METPHSKDTSRRDINSQTTKSESSLINLHLSTHRGRCHSLHREFQSSEQPLGHSVFSQSTSEPGPGAKLIKAGESPTIRPSCYAPKGQPPPCQLPAFNWVLTSLYFTVSIIPLSLLSPSPSPFLSPSPPFPLLPLPPTLFFFGISESKHFLHIKMWNSFWHWAGNRVEPAICPYLFLSLFTLPLFSYSLSLSPSLSLSFSFPFSPAPYSVFSLPRSMHQVSHLTFFCHLESILRGNGLLAPNYIFRRVAWNREHNPLHLFVGVWIY